MMSFQIAVQLGIADGTVLDATHLPEGLIPIRAATVTPFLVLSVLLLEVVVDRGVDGGAAVVDSDDAASDGCGRPRKSSVLQEKYNTT